MRGSWCLHWQTISRCRKMEDGLQGGRGGGSRPGRSSVGAVQCWMNSVSRSSPLIIYIQLSHCGYKSLVLNFTCGYKNTFTRFAVYSLKNKTRCTLNWIFFFLFLLTHSYLPIIVECCWTAASNSRSSMVHSPMIAHSERKTSRGSCYSLSASPRAPQISSDCISACVCVCVVSRCALPSLRPPSADWWTAVLSACARRAGCVPERSVEHGVPLGSNPALSRLLCVTHTGWCVGVRGTHPPIDRCLPPMIGCAAKSDTLNKWL